VDGIQGVGPHVVDVRRTPVDFLAADGHKWLLGPEGAGFLYVRRNWIDRLRPIGVGWHSVVGSYNTAEPEFRLKPTASRWEGGSFNMPGLLAFGASLGLFLEIGPDLVSARILERANRVRELACETGWSIFGPTQAEEQSAIVALEKPGHDPARVTRALRDQGVVVSNRRGRLRISPHMYNDDSDLDRLRDALSQAG
jgi:selenocysteine lyase/cysteine desulfurase